MDDLIRWVKTQLDEDENCAHAAGHGYGYLPLNTEHNAGWTRLDLADNVRPSYDVRYLKRFDPARVLREVEAKRQILDRCERAFHDHFDQFAEVEFAEEVLKMLALPFSDRPGYREEWRP